MIDKRKKKIDKIRIENLQFALLLLAVKLNQLRHIKYNLLEPHINKQNWWCSVVSYSEFEIKKSFTLSDLSFIQSSMYKFLLELSIADEAYSGTVSYFNERSRLHRDKLQPAQKAILEKNPPCRLFNYPYIFRRTAYSRNECGNKWCLQPMRRGN